VPNLHWPKAVLAVGHITPIIDTDGNISGMPAVVCYEGQAYPALAVASLAAATGRTTWWHTTKLVCSVQAAPN